MLIWLKEGGTGKSFILFNKLSRIFFTAAFSGLFHWVKIRAIIKIIAITNQMPENINFKRKKDGKNGSWGVGLDYLLKNYWDDLDKIVKDNYYGRHNAKLINSLLPKVFSALQEAILKMKRFGDWIKKAKTIQKFGVSAESLNDKVVFIDAVVQFLRETSLGKIERSRTPILKKILGKSEIKEIKGIIASTGLPAQSGGQSKIRGTVKIVLSEKDFSKVRKGDILVTKETDASFLPAIIKAKAIITDKGGILCHAAIVARELKKVCLVGTKIATQFLKDGDRIEIDVPRGRIELPTPSSSGMRSATELPRRARSLQSENFEEIFKQS